MKNFNRVVFTIAIVLLFLPVDVFSSSYQYHHVFPQSYFGSQGDDSTLHIINFDHRFVHSNNSSFDSIWKGIDRGGDIGASDMRTGAVAAGSGVISYGLIAYDYNSGNPSFPYLFSTKLDAVSNFLYNLSYIMSIPVKCIHGTKHIILKPSYGVLDFIWLIYQLWIGFILASIMLFLGPIIGLIFHPFYSVINLTVKIFGTLYDLVWYSLIKPILNIVLLFF